MSQISKIGVIGAGNMGSGIVQKLAQEGFHVVMVDIKEEFVSRGISNIKSLLHEAVERKIFGPERVDDILSRIKGSTDLAAVSDADFVIEAVFEDKSVKLDLFRRLDDICAPKTIFATNTSSFFVKEFAEQTRRPDRFVGLHYFYHPAKNRLLEVIPHDGTSPETIEAALLLSKLHAKTGILVKDAPGFAVNRFFVPFLNEAARMLQENVANIPTIEEAAKRAFKIGMGAFELMNVTGIPIAVHASRTLGKELGPFYDTAPILQAQMEKGHNWDLTGDVDESRIEAVVDRFYGVVLGVAATLVDEGVASVEDTDRGAKIGLRWTQGPFEIMNKIGIDRTCDLVRSMTKVYDDFHMPDILSHQQKLAKPFEFRLVDLDIKETLATITINRPEAMNALNETVFKQMGKHFNTAESDPQVKAIVFEGAGKAFVAGADIRYFLRNIHNDKIKDTVTFTRNWHELLLRIENSPKLTIALLDGLSLGGGSELALACQCIVATRAGSMGFPETGIGIYPGLGGMLRLARQVGPELAKYYVLTGATLTANDAEALGIVTCLVQPSETAATIQDLADKPRPDKYRDRKIPESFMVLKRLFSADNIPKLLSGEPPADAPENIASKIVKTLGYKAPLALKLVNDIIDQQVDRTMQDAIEIELSHLMEIFGTADALEGLSSLGRKRPVFKGE